MDTVICSEDINLDLDLIDDTYNNPNVNSNSTMKNY